MADNRSPPLETSQRLAFLLLTALLSVLWLAGGSSRADAMGQVVSRAAAWAVVIGLILFLPAPRWQRVRVVALLFGGAVVLVALQLVPLPPGLWAALPGHAMLARLPAVAGIEPSWLPMTISREATLNALGSLIVPGAALALLTLLPTHAYRPIVGLLMLLIVAACVLGLFQFTGAQFDHPLINDRPGEVGGPFANRNHFALFAAFGAVLAPAFAFGRRGGAGWTLAMAAGLELLCLVMILAIGSRAGIVLGTLGLVLGLLVVRRDLASRMQRVSRKVILSLTAGGLAILSSVMALVILMGRAESISRFTEDGAAEGLRGMIRPTVIEMIGKYFPFGSGFGTFDPAYRIDEPTALLRPAYVNLAHNDLLQIPLDGGVPAVLLLLGALAWLALSSWRAWGRDGSLHGRLGSAMLALVVVASALDYPARTPMIMAVSMIAAVWLALPSTSRGSVAS